MLARSRLLFFQLNWPARTRYGTALGRVELAALVEQIMPSGSTVAKPSMSHTSPWPTAREWQYAQALHASPVCRCWPIRPETNPPSIDLRSVLLILSCPCPHTWLGTSRRLARTCCAGSVTDRGPHGQRGAFDYNGPHLSNDAFRLDGPLCRHWFCRRWWPARSTWCLHGRWPAPITGCSRVHWPARDHWRFLFIMARTASMALFWLNGPHRTSGTLINGGLHCWIGAFVHHGPHSLNGSFWLNGLQNWHSHQWWPALLDWFL